MSKNALFHASAWTATAFAAVAAATSAAAQTADPANGALSEIVVTAQKRSESAQNVPIAINSIGIKQLSASGITTSTELKELSPALNFNTNLGGFGQPRIRGIGTNATGPGIENPVATYVDGVYIGASTGAIFSLQDVQQIDVLKGPQGTLFGRNATGGVIQVTSLAPSDDFHGSMQAYYGNYQSWGGSGYLTGGLAQGLSASLAGVYNTQGKGFGKNLFTGNDVQKGTNFAFRGKLRYTSDDGNSIITASGDYSSNIATDPTFRLYQGLTILGTTMPGGPYDIYTQHDPQLRVHQGGGSVNITHDFADVELVNIAAWRKSRLFTAFDPDETPVNLLNFSEVQVDEQFTNELQLVSRGKKRFNWVLGGFLMWSDGKYDPIQTQGPLLCGFACTNQIVTQTVDQSLHSYAAFAQGTYAIGPSTNVTVGLRYTSDHRKMNEGQVITTIPFSGTNTVVTPAAQAAAKTFPKLTWRLSLDHRFSDSIMGYASYNRGFKSGSFQPDSFPIQVLLPETVDAFEAGFKADLFDHKVRLNVSGFYYNYRNIQANQIIQGVLYVYDAPGSINYGLDADLVARITPNLIFNAGVAALHARYKSGFNTPFWSVPIPNAFSNANPFFTALGGNSVIQCVPGTNYNGTVFAPCDASHNRLQNTPELVLNSSVDYTIHIGAGTVNLNGIVYYNGGYFDDPQNRLRQPAYTLLDANITWRPRGDAFFIKAWGKNLSNTFYTLQQNALDTGDSRGAAPPRTYGLTIGTKF
ncbi:TonB-dependent receptor [Novosphingobium sp. SG720]|uniref:TonB-dependent receptor n=1 Tax=Novosphingobium sp. SG720 TaxID=2586998 RepID=UPI0014469899|nr:TonB-dependent receptor [Novosphingobium sp. SG720]NKJ44509.1 iron complex outermembrane receptor protein [Novosphingobium sp. SG720]